MMQAYITKKEVIRIRNGTVEESVIVLNEIFSRVYNKSVEDAIRQTPDLMLSLLASQQAEGKLKKDFYDRNPGFLEHRDIAQATVQEIETKCPGKDYEYILNLAEPMIQSRITKMKELTKLPLDKPEAFDSDGRGAL